MIHIVSLWVVLTVKNKEEKKKKASQGNMLEALTVHSLKLCQQYTVFSALVTKHRQLDT